MVLEKALRDGEYEDVGLQARVNEKRKSTSDILSKPSPNFSQNTDDFTLSHFGGLMGNKHRLDILKALKTCPKPVVGFCGQLGITSHHARHHLAVLVENGLVAGKPMTVAGVRGTKTVMVFGLSVLGEKVLDAYNIGGKL